MTVKDGLSLSSENAKFMILVTASGLDALLDGRARAVELALRGHLRSFEKVYAVRGGAVRCPSWLAQPAATDRVDLMSPLLSPFQLLDALTPSPPPPRWHTPERSIDP